MNIIIGIINVLLTPFVGVSLYYKKNNMTISMNVDLLSRYITFMVCNLVMDVLLLNIIGLDIEVWSKPYTVISLVTSCLIPYIVQIVRAYVSVKLEVKPKSDSLKQEKSK